MRLNRSTLRQYETYVYTWLSIGIVYTLLFNTLLNSWFCIGLAAWWLFISKKEWNWQQTRSRIVVLFAAVYLLTLTGLFYSANTGEGWFRVQQKLPILLFPIVFGTTNFVNEDLVKKLSLNFVAATTMAGVVSFSYALFRYTQTRDTSLLQSDGLIIFPDLYKYVLGLFCLLSIVIILFYLPTFQRKRLSISTAIFLSAILFLLSTRMIVGLWMVTLLFFTFRYIKGLLFRLLAAGSLLIILVIAILTIPALNRQWTEMITSSPKTTINLDQDASLNQSWGGKAIRMAIWKCSKDVIREHWLTGVGTGDIQDTLQAAYEKRKFYFASRYNRYNTHNQYLQTWIGHGIGGVLILGLAFVIPFFVYRPPAGQIVYFFFLGIMIFISFTESLLEINKGIVWYSFFNSIFAFRSGITRK